MGVVLTIVGAALGGGGLAAVPMLRTAGRLRTALRTACDLADANAVAETDEDVAAAKARAAAEQQAKGVRDLVQKIRGKR
jgi:CelD/BcsL family acetyltransferase involved in cellulose biosynthesis